MFPFIADFILLVFHIHLSSLSLWSSSVFFLVTVFSVPSPSFSLWMFCSTEVEGEEKTGGWRRRERVGGCWVWWRSGGLETHLVVIRAPHRYCDSCLRTPTRLLQTYLVRIRSLDWDRAGCKTHKTCGAPWDHTNTPRDENTPLHKKRCVRHVAETPQTRL